MVELQVRKLKDLWRSGTKNITDNKGSSFFDLDWLLNPLCADLNNVPLEQHLSNICPADSSLAYTQLPVGFEYHNGQKNRQIINKLSQVYKQLSQSFRGNRLLSPYLWRSKYLGQVRRGCSVNDVVFIQSLKKLGLVCQVKETQLNIRYIDSAKQPRTLWFRKADLTHLLSGSVFLSNPKIPEHDVTIELNKTRGLQLDSWSLSFSQIVAVHYFQSISFN